MLNSTWAFGMSVDGACRSPRSFFDGLLPPGSSRPTISAEIRGGNRQEQEPQPVGSAGSSEGLAGPLGRRGEGNA